jgi:hypothetical protein
MKEEIRIAVNPDITEDQLFNFYKRNHICEEGYGRERVAIVLRNSSLIVAAFEGITLVGIARAMCDGLSADIMEFSLVLFRSSSTRCRGGA